MGRIESKGEIIDSLGNVAGADLLAGYQVANKDEASSPNYYGYINTAGQWYIQRVSATDIDFSVGSTGYGTAWTGRAALTYAKFDVAF